MNDLFNYVDFETISTCNRTCPTCLRNSHPDREALSDWFEPNYLDVEVIKDALDQVIGLGFTGGVCLSHYNEPLMDERLSEIASMARAYPQFDTVYFHSNGDYLTEDMAKDLDGRLDRIVFSLYMDEPKKSARKEWIYSLFSKTKIDVITQSDHIATHFSPAFDIKALIEKNHMKPCSEPQMRVVINHRRQYLLCCDDVIGNFGLGTFPETSIEEYWFGEYHMKIMNDLKNTGGRLMHPYCATCPRP